MIVNHCESCALLAPPRHKQSVGVVNGWSLCHSCKLDLDEGKMSEKRIEELKLANTPAKTEVIQ